MAPGHNGLTKKVVILPITQQATARRVMPYASTTMPAVYPAAPQERFSPAVKPIRTLWPARNLQGSLRTQANPKGLDKLHQRSLAQVPALKARLHKKPSMLVQP